MKTNTTMEERFDEQFKGWTIRDYHEFYRNFDSIKSFINQERALAVSEAKREIREEIDKYDLGHYDDSYDRAIAEATVEELLESIPSLQDPNNKNE